MRKGASCNHWSSKEISFLVENAGKMPKRDIQFALKRSKKSIERMAEAMHLSLRVPLWRLEWCNECASWRVKVNERTGRCKVCQTRENLAKEEGRCVEAYQRMTPEQRRIYDESEAKRGRRKAFAPRPQYPANIESRNKFAASKAQQDYYKALEEWNFDKVQAEYGACRKRLERMRKALGENPQKKS